MSFYFAYGSNMNMDQMKERCPSSKFLNRAVLKNYKIDFTIFSPKRNCGCADVVKEEGSEVWGLLYEINDADRLALDTFEGHPEHYKRFEVEVCDDSGKQYIADAYEVVNKSSETLKPSKHYLGLMQNAGKDYSFPKNYLDQLSKVKTID